MTEQQKKLPNGRYEGTNYRFSDKFIKVMTGWLIAWIFIGTGLGFGLGALGDVIFSNDYSSDVPDWYNILAASLAISGVVLPLVVGAVLGAMAINKYAAPVAVLLLAAIGAYTYGSLVDGQGIWMLYGVIAGIVSIALFFYIGFQAKVPIWLQLPMLGSPRFYLTKDKKSKENPRNIKNITK